MPRKTKSVTGNEDRWAPVPSDVLDQFVREGPLSAPEIEAASQRFKKALIERALGAELSHHLGYRPGAAKPADAVNHRNGTSEKTVLTDDGPVPIAVPGDRQGTFAPQLIPKHERRFTGFDDKIIALYARGLTVREIQAFLAEMYAVQVSPDLISSVTDAVVAEVTAWQTRPLETLYPVVFFDALSVKIRDEGVVRSKAVYLALGVLRDGTREILGVWIEQTEGAKFWMRVFADLKSRGCDDILIAVTDGLAGMPEALAAVYPATTLQTCVVHFNSAESRLRGLERPEAAGGRPAADLHGTVRRDRARRARDLCDRPVGAEVSDGRAGVASCLAAGHSLLCLSPRRTACDLHDQRPRKRECATPQDHQDAWALSDR